MSFNANVTSKPALLNTAVTNTGAGVGTSLPAVQSTPSHQGPTGLAHPFEVLRGAMQHGLDLLGGAIQRGIIIIGGHNSPDVIRNQLDGKSKDLQSQDKLGNFEIQTLMSDYNEAQTLSSSVQKKKDDTEKSVIQKL